MKKILLFSLIVFACSAANAQADSLQQYTGKFKFPEGSPVTEVTVTLEAGVLSAASNMGSTELKKTEGDVFEVVAYGGTATFKRNAEGKITGVRIQVSDIDIEGTKTEGILGKEFYWHAQAR